MTAHEFVEALWTYCALAGASVTSYGRTQRHNVYVKGVRFSAHRFWLAADVVYDFPDRPPAAERKELARRLGLRRIAEPDHDHLQPLDWPAG